MFAFKSSFVLIALLASAMAIPAPDAGAKPFTKQNGEDAIALNNKFETLTPDSSCTDGDDACIGGKFAQCSGGKFLLTACGAGTECVALPLVNKPGTSVTCSTEADKNARIAATGATGSGGSGGSGGGASPPSDTASSSPVLAAQPSASPAPSSGTAPAGAKSFTLQNGKDAQALNAKFATLTPDSPCTDGENACINNQFAQCANSKFVLTACAGGLQCAALPLVNSAGTSTTCVDNAQAIARIKATGAGDSLTGN